MHTLNHADFVLVVAATCRRMNLHMTRAEIDAAAKRIAANLQAKTAQVGDAAPVSWRTQEAAEWIR